MRDPPFVGRRTELDALLKLLDSVEGGTAATALISGESGVGKSRLLREVAHHAAQRGITVLIGAGVPMAAEFLPYAPFVEALREHLGQIPDSEARPAETGLSARAYQFERVLKTLRQIADRAPVLLVLEDLHWADQTTLELLTFLVRTVRSDRIGLAVTWRTDGLRRDHPLRHVVAELSRADHVERLNLSPFDLDETAQLLDGIQGEAVAADVSRSIHERVQGNPFLAQEWLAATGGGPLSGLPQTVREVLLARTAGLSDRSRQLLRICTVISGRIDHGVLVSAARNLDGLTDAEVRAAVEEAIDAGLLLPDDTGYRFRHDLVAQSLYDDLLPFERAGLHEAVARALEALHAPTWEWRRPAEIAAHLLKADQRGDALKAFVAAGSAAADVGAFVEARQQLETALNLWERVHEPERLVQLERYELLLRAAENAALAGDPLRAVALARAGLGTVQSRDPLREGIVNMWLGRFLWAAGRGMESLAAHENSVRLVPKGASVERSSVLEAHAHALLHAGQYGRARKCAEEAIRIAMEAGTPDEEGRARRTLGVALVEAGDIETGLNEIATARDIGRAVGCSDDELDAYEALGDALDRATRLEDAVQILAEGSSLARERGLSRVHAAKLLAREAHSLMRLGRWDCAGEVLEEAERLEPAGAVALQVALERSLLALDRGELDAADEQLDRADQLASLGVEAAHEKAKLAVLRATSLMWRGQLDEAVEIVERGLRAVEETDERRHRAQLCVLGLALEEGRAERARALGEPQVLEESQVAGRRYMAELQRVSPEHVPIGVVELKTGALHLARLEDNDDVEGWIGLADEWGRLKEPWPEAHSRLYAARVALAQGQETTAREQLRIAHALVRDLPSTAPLIAGIEAMARSMRVELSDPESRGASPPPDLGLTPRELEVLGLLCEGRTNAEIGERLFISPKTASVHVSNIMQKLGVQRRAEAATVALRLGLPGPCGQ